MKKIDLKALLARLYAGGTPDVRMSIRLKLMLSMTAIFLTMLVLMNVFIARNISQGNERYINDDLVTMKNNGLIYARQMLVLKQMDNNIYEAALDLGATPMKALLNVVIPQIMPGIVSGFLLSLTMSMDDFVISLFTSGAVVSTLSLEIYSMTKRGITPEINALSTIIFLIVLTVLIITNVRKPKTDGNSRKA